MIGVLVAAPAFADVTVSPTTAAQGSGENLTFHLTNTGTAPLGSVTLQIPDDTPVAEVYPLSVDDWAPKIVMKPLATPLATIHGGTPATESAKSIIWLAMPGRQLAPGKSADLSIAIGPLPTLSTMRFTLATTYADGKPGPTMPAQLALTPAAEGQTATHAHGGTATDTTGTTAEDPESAAFAAAVADATRGPSLLSIGGWVIAALVLLGGAVYFLRGRHRANEEDEPDDEDEKAPAKAEDTKEPVSAGKWSLKP
ncbi:DUF1775 domain-containing protein [Paractinoplanes durhamensis]|uniref:YncI copper-binding domain-containing protein n=1 Tax=Paractinoplanes durhamensis TaxID=113563 RepID=A0ABQ3YTP4_9ACTN|nr:DUF1775 domain-containing protein [Actinoplanes durhamensis]GIE00949.1 hypothetical protein Adu01nite_22990 [Actinoplanes durhamensis]